MPYRTEWVDPELVLEHRGVKVYRAYKDDNLAHGPWGYWFALHKPDESGHLESGYSLEFDIRTLKAFPPDARSHDFDQDAVLRAAIDAGEITYPEGDKPKVARHVSQQRVER